MMRILIKTFTLLKFEKERLLLKTIMLNNRGLLKTLTHFRRRG
jgi:hypothetical protein